MTSTRLKQIVSAVTLHIFASASTSGDAEQILRLVLTIFSKVQGIFVKKGAKTQSI